MNNSKISVCIPCYNAEDYIEETIQSVLNQTYKNFTLHIIDDKSTDNTLKVVSYIKDKRIKIHKNKKNLGMFKNMTKCLTVSTTPYIKILSADDTIAPYCLEEQYKVLRSNPKIVLVFTASHVMTSEGFILLKRRLFSTNRMIKGKELVKKILKAGRNPIGEPSVVMFRNDIALKKGIEFNSSYKHIGDLDVWINLLKYGHGYYIDKPLSFFRIHKSGGTPTLLRKSLGEHIRLIVQYGKMFDLGKLDYIVAFSKLIFYILIKNIIIKLFFAR